MLMLKVMYQQYPQTDIFNGTSIIDTAWDCTKYLKEVRNIHDDHKQYPTYEQYISDETYCHSQHATE